MIIPPWVYGAVGLTLAAVGFGAGWTVRDWKRDSEVLEGFEQATKDLNTARETVDLAAGAYEQEKADAVTNTTIRENSIREIFRTAPPVDVDCAAPDAAVGVLNDAISAANARASGQPAPAVSGAP
jgi:hypothetical protein